MDVAILMGTLVSGGLAARWADAQFLLAQGDETLDLRQSYERLQHDGVFLLVVLTMGVGWVAAWSGESWTRRGMAQPGVMAVFVGVLVGGVMALDSWLTSYPSQRILISTLFRDVLEFRLPMAILGAWIALRLGGLWRPAREDRDRVGRVVGWGWLLLGGLRILHRLVFD